MPAFSTLRRELIADNGGSSGLVGVIIGVVLVLGLGLVYFLVGERIGLRSPTDVNVKIDAPSAHGIK
jgi:hypothetical protein